MRIAFIGHHVAPICPPFAGGVESLTWYLARWLARRGHEVVLYAVPGSAVPGVDVRELDLAPRISRRARADVSMPAPAFMDAHHAYQSLMLSLAEEGEDFDLVHSHSLHYLPVAMAPLISAPTLLTLHCPPTPWLESSLRAQRGPRPALSAVSDATALAWAEVAPIVDVVANGVDLDAWCAGPGGSSAVWSGRLVPEKAPHLAIDAARTAGMALRLAGPISDADYFERCIAPRLGADVTYVGHLPHPALTRLVGSSAVAVVTPDWEEPFGLVAAEAMACGTPVAAFARGGLPRLVGQHAGRLASPGDVGELAEAIQAAARLPRAGVRDHAVAQLGIDAMGRGYEALYARLADQDERPSSLYELA